MKQMSLGLPPVMTLRQWVRGRLVGLELRNAARAARRRARRQRRKTEYAREVAG